ncbi:MAG TPA: nuclear transport factor 2 family protein [Gammaproteobacteria bacterium]
MSSKSVQAVEKCVKQMYDALISRDGKVLTALSSSGLSYGHSKGKIENREEFVKNILAEDLTHFTSIKIDNQTVQLVGNNAIVRHGLKGETILKGVPGTIQIQILMVWQDNGGKWELIARQAFLI